MLLPRQLVQLAVGQPSSVRSLKKLLIGEPHEAEALLRVQPPDPPVMENSVPVYYREAVGGAPFGRMGRSCRMVSCRD